MLRRLPLQAEAEFSNGEDGLESSNDAETNFHDHVNDFFETIDATAFSPPPSPLHTRVQEAREDAYSSERPVDIDGAVCISSGHDMLRAYHLGWLPEVAAKVLVALTWDAKRLWKRIDREVDHEQWILATHDQFKIWLQRDALPHLFHALRSIGEYELVKAQFRARWTLMTPPLSSSTK